MTNLNPFAKLYALIFAVSALVFIALHWSFQYSLGFSLLVLFAMIVIPASQLLFLLLVQFPIKKNILGYSVSVAAIALAISNLMV